MLHYALKKRIFPNISSYHLGHDKIEMTRALAVVCPQHIPDTLMLANSDSNARKVVEHFGFPLIAKDIRSARGIKSGPLIHAYLRSLQPASNAA